MTRHAQITQNNKFTISLRYLKKKVSDEVDFLQADKNESLLQMNNMQININFLISWFQDFRPQSLLQGDTIIIDGHDQAFSKYSK